MNWIILIGDEKLTLDRIKKIEHHGCIHVSVIENSRFSVDYGKFHVFYDYVEDLINDYEDDERPNIPFTNPNFILMTFNSIDLMWKILKQENYLRNIYIDDDHGHIVVIEEYINNWKKWTQYLL